mgnify:CR=1 FL=1
MVIRSNKPPYGELFAIEAAVIPPDIKITRTERYEYHTNGLFFLSFLNENPARNTANIVKGDVIPANIRWMVPARVAGAPRGSWEKKMNKIPRIPIKAIITAATFKLYL